MPATTNNRAEFVAVLEALKSLNQACAVQIVTDSTLVEGYLVRGWRRKNAVLREMGCQIDELIRRNGHVLTVVVVKGHKSNRLNRRADALARKAAAGQ